MKKLNFTLALLCLSLPLSVFSQNLDEKVSSFYWQERFSVADENEDGTLEKAEMAKFPSEFAYYLDVRNFQAADDNQDGALTFNEMRTRRTSEANYRTAMENRQLASLLTAYPEFAKADLTVLKKYPEITTKLLSNYVWMKANSALVFALSKELSWLAAHSDAAMALNKNLLWMVSNPKSAKLVYESAKKLNAPEVLGWRAEHMRFMQQNPAVTDREFTPDAYQALIKIGKK